LLKKNYIDLKLANGPQALKGFRIIQMSDLHFTKKTSQNFLNKILRKVKEAQPDLIVFTGDFIDNSQLEDEEHLRDFLKELSAPYGVFACLGNHDYEKYVTVGESGESQIKKDKGTPFIKDCFRKLFSKGGIFKKTSEEVFGLKRQHELDLLLQSSNVKVLENMTIQLDINGEKLNLCGLGDLWLGRFCPEEAFKTYKPEFPGIILSHNPDSIFSLRKFPGDLILSGHTHGGQVNIPFLRQRFVRQRDPKLLRGMQEIEGKKIYINRGLGSHFSFRWFSIPELTQITFI